MKTLKIIALTILSVISSHAESANYSRGTLMNKNQIYVGGRIGISAPIALGRSADEISFKNVASYAFSGMIDGMWMQSANIGIGGELGYSGYPYKSEYWSSLNYRGSFDASYKDIFLNVTGKVIMGKKEIKPYIGVSFGGHYLLNKLDFVSNYKGTSEDESVNYETKKFNMGFGIGGGLFCKIGATTYISTGIRLNIIPYLKEEIITITDSYTFQERKIVVNPHGNQNNISVYVGLHFAANKPNIKRIK